MANETVVRVVITSDPSGAITGIRKVEGAQGEFEQHSGAATQRMRAGWIAVAAAAAVSAVAIARAVRFVAESVRFANEAEEAEAKLSAVIRSTGGAAGYTADELKRMASGLQGLTTYGDDAIVRAQALMLTFTKVGREVFPQAIQAVLNMSTALDQDLKSSAIQLGKALNDPIEGVSALQRVGVSFTETQKEQIRTMVEAGRVADAQRLILAELNVEFGGQAAAAAQTYSGRVKQLKEVYGDFREEVGFLITKNQFFAGTIQILLKFFQDLGQKVKDNRLYLMELSRDGFIWMIEAIGKTVEALRFFHNGWLMIKLVGQAAVVGISEAVLDLFQTLRFLLLPLDLIFEGLVKLGTIETNPFDTLESSLGTFAASTHEVMGDVIAETERVNGAYDAVGRTIRDLVGQMRAVKVGAVPDVSGAGGRGGGGGGGGYVETDAMKKAVEQGRKEMEAQRLAWEAMRARVDVEEELARIAKEGATVEAARKELEYARQLGNVTQSAVIREKYLLDLQDLKLQQSALLTKAANADEAERVRLASEYALLGEKIIALKEYEVSDPAARRLELEREIFDLTRQQMDLKKAAADRAAGSLAAGSPMGSELSTLMALDLGTDPYQQDFDRWSEIQDRKVMAMEEAYQAELERLRLQGISEAEIIRQTEAEKAAITDAYNQYAVESDAMVQQQKASQAMAYMSIAMNTANALLSFAGGNAKAQFVIAKGVAVAMAIVQGHMAAIGAAAALAGIPIVGPALAAAAYAKWMTIGYINAGLIAATAIGQMAGGGGSASAGGGGVPSFAAAGSPPSSAPQEPEKKVFAPEINIQIYGDGIFDEAALNRFAREIVGPLQKAYGDGQT
jgi:hypothetical protein